MNTSLLTDPEAFFQHRSENPGLLRPLGIVFLAAIVSIGGSILLIQSVPELPIVFIIIQSGGIIVGFIGQFIIWVILAIVFYLISIAVGGEGSLGDTLKLTGWGFAPQIISGIINTIAYYIALQAVEPPSFPQNLDLQNPAQAQEVTERYIEFTVDIATHSAVQVAAAIAILLLIWQIIIWIYGVKEARNLTTRGAVISAGIPTGLYLLYNLYTLLNQIAF